MSSRPKATNPQTGETVEYDGKSWVPVQTAQSIQLPDIREDPAAITQPVPRGTARLASTPTPEPSLLDKVKSYMPSPRTALRTGGGMIGGAIGGLGGTIAGTPIGGVGGAALGGAAGSSIGESVYQLGSRMMGRPAPQTGAEAAQAQSGALAQGALQEGIPALMQGPVVKGLRSSATEKIGESVNVGQQPLKVKNAVKKVAEDVIDEFPVSPTKSSLFNKLSEHAADANVGVNRAYNAAEATGKTFNGSSIVPALEQELAKYKVQGSVVPGAQPRVDAYQEVIDWLKQHPSFTPKDFQQIKGIWDNIVQPTRNVSALAPQDPAKIEALKEASDLVRDVIHSTFPATAKADRTAHVWIKLSQVLGESVDKGFGKEALMQIVPRSAAGGSLGAAAAMYEGKSPYAGALIGGTLGVLSRSALWNTISVAERAALIRALESNSGRAALHAIAVTGSGAGEELLDQQ
jgi:hypothetical protein